MHECNDFGDDGVTVASDASAKGDDGDNAGGIALQMLDVVCRSAEEIVGHELGLVVLNGPVTTHCLRADAQVHQLAVDAPVVALLVVANLHGHQVRLA